MKLCYWMYAGPAHIGTLRVASSFKNVHAVMHAPLGDDYFNVMRSMLERERDFTAATQTVVDRHVLARGSQDKVIETIIRKDHEDQPDLILLTPTCTSSILQEDLQNYADRANESTTCDALLADVNHYRYNEFEASDRILLQIVKHYMQKYDMKAHGKWPAPVTEKTPRPSVNIIGALGLGFHNQHDLNELLRVLRQLKIDVNMMIPHSSGSKGFTYEIPYLTRAWCNLVPYRENGELTAKFLEKNYEIPYVRTPPQGLASLHNWVLSLGSILHNKAIDLQLHSEQFSDGAVDLARLQDYFGEFPARMVQKKPTNYTTTSGCRRSQHIYSLQLGAYAEFLDVQGRESCAGSWFINTIDCQNLFRKRAFVFGDSTHAAAMTIFLNRDMGIQVSAAGTFCKHDEIWFRNSIEGLADTIFLTEDNTRVSTLIAQLQPDGIFGTQMERHIGKRLGIPCSVISAPVHIQNFKSAYSPFFGYEGVNYMSDLVYNTFALGMEDHLLDMFGGHDIDELPNMEDTETIPEIEPLQKGEPSKEMTSIWSSEARKVMKGIPIFVRPGVIKNVNTYAQERELSKITPLVIMEAKRHFGKE